MTEQRNHQSSQPAKEADRSAPDTGLDRASPEVPDPSQTVSWTVTDANATDDAGQDK